MIYIKTSLIFSVLQRSLSRIDAYSKLLKTNNIMVLNSIARTQIDNCIFIYGVYLLIDNSENINDIYNNFIKNNKKLSNYKIKNKQLRDSYIVSEIDKVYSGFEDMYKFYCRFIHCSDSAVLYSTNIIEDYSKILPNKVGKILERIASKNIKKLHKSSINQIFYKWLNTNKNLSFHKSSKVALPALITRRLLEQNSSYIDMVNNSIKIFIQ